ncbi:beta-ketoacyl synthase [Amycolatopsis pigmentata]|uniref:Beta-ketoacyl synthase n=1 Tax=Amycolatopsis pigmentata TaxID=450801 RepID=A0ABW5FYM2_9PSEU
MTVLEFVGEPFDALAWAEPDEAPSEPTAVPAVQAPPTRAAADLAHDLRKSIMDAHVSALRAQERMQLALLRTPPPAPLRASTVDEGAFKPLARTPVTNLDRAHLERLAEGAIADVFGPAYDQGGANPDIRLGAGNPLVLTSATLRPDGVAVTWEGQDGEEAARQAAQLFALYLGLHLCLPDAVFAHEPLAPLPTGPLDFHLTAADLVPRPWLRLHGHGTDVAVTVEEKPGTPIGPERGGQVPDLGRKGALLSEFHMAHLARGDQGIAMGPEFAHYTGRKATRLPTGGLLLVDRVVRIDGERGKFDHATYTTEYDSPADSWYYAETANDSMPNFVYMETSLQAALLVGYYLGPTLSTPERTMSLRNLGGTATVLREVDLRDKTIRQESELLSTTILPGSSLQSFAYTLFTDGEPFYRGETLFGYFSDEALANQTGLDAGKSVPTWLDEHRPATRRIDLDRRRADPAARLCSRGNLTLLDYVDVVDGGGHYGEGYLHSVRRIAPDDWFFARHFHLDPVIPGSLGVESVIHAMQEWLLDAGLADGLRDPGFIVPEGSPFTWKYRGQFLPSDGACTLEVHLKEIRRGPGRVRVTADASLWKPGLRIYELTDVAVEIREQGAQPW